MKLFGKALFEHKPEVDLYDFAQHGLIRATEHFTYTVDSFVSDQTETKSKVKKPKEPKTKTPKEVYNLKSLNDDKYEIVTDEDYIIKHAKSLKDKMALIPQKKVQRSRGQFEEFVEAYGASKYGYDEMESLVERLENRRKYAENEEFFSQFPYTRSELINNVLQEHGNLQSRRVEEFIPDLPEEAIEVMTEYREKVKKICGKRAVFYIIADKKDFERNDKKRDPILLVQSPFALSWQIIGAWDEEMVYLGDL